jgi:predicted dienelactone hydrolase
MSRMFSARQITGRVDEVRMSIDRILEDLDIGPSVDTSRIALLGFGSGATTALLMAGARLEGEYFAGYCDVAANSDPYCTPWTRPRMEQLANDPSVKASFKDERVKLVAAISPAFGMLFVPESLDRINMPIFLVRMGNDRLNASPRYIEGLRAHLPSSSLYGVLENSSPTLLMAPCSTLSRYGGASIECTPEIIKQQEALYHALSEKLAEFIGSMGRATLPPPSKTGARSKPDRRAKDTETAPVKTENAVKTPASE